ncbi:Gfo/Idh/MocA family protein [Spirosoma fluviale]|uniref:UDP-N-acetyl-2-amino-2-deoxyglucuronate dehydrogenase n=1 Tax=Spirosoma fluviale TaxID=1597977 RepID=A0A286FDC0_9BACT|nr:Gfo/Idh/MocA family oxidoreductase [Spirosoma fluviale]SOD81183.1 UDP-N-acetyl-2-amino-2-deoxyglucuronate dehydrogenase [Spirosoma fluviale]
MKRFALVGAAGFIAPRHLKAIKETGNQLVTAFDKFDSVGVMDSYFPEADFFTEFERFDRQVDKLRRKGNPIDYVSICSPNYLHDAHIRFGLRNGADVICEKPLVLNPWNIDALAEMEKETGKRVNNILQLRLHPSIVALKKRIAEGPTNKIYDLDLAYITSRGKWYNISWKGDASKSGGIATNIGVHFFDMLSWIFGKVKLNQVHIHEENNAAGYLELENARVRWFLSTDYTALPEAVQLAGKRTYRSLQIEGEEIEFSDGFTDLHTHSYEHILSGEGFGLLEACPSIEIVHHIRNASLTPLNGDYHPMANSRQRTVVSQ